MTRFTVLLPVTRPPAFLPCAVESVLGQTHADLELFIVSDGAPAATIEWAKTAEKRDSRVRLFDFPKGARHGEAHRHAALQEASGACIAQIADDDLWFPEFLSELELHLRVVDFGNLIQCMVDVDGAISSVPGDLAVPTTCERMLQTRWNFFGPTVTGYRLDAYRQLAEGWSPAPMDLPTDLHMWRKFLRDDRLTKGTRFAIRSVSFPTPARVEWSEERRANEIAALAERIRDPDTRRDIAAEGLRAHYTAGRAEIVTEASMRLRALVDERNAFRASLDQLQRRPTTPRSEPFRR